MPSNELIDQKKGSTGAGNRLLAKIRGETLDFSAQRHTHKTRITLTQRENSTSLQTQFYISQTPKI
jgi:hypothetical protein